MENIITVANLTKYFKKRIEQRHFFSNKYEYVNALDNISFYVKEAESLAIIGKNGSGKSTLLKILLGVYKPTSGEIKISKTINGILDSGLGFHKDLTGYDNILILGKIIGLSVKEIKQKIDEIVEFAELQHYIYTPLKHYSNGMISRLSFSIVSLSQAEILIFDEVLAFGDIHFQQKAYQYLKKLNINGRTLLIVSHYMMGLVPLCNRFILLDKGKITADGPSYEVLPKYYDSLVNVLQFAQVKDIHNNKKVNFSLADLVIEEIKLSLCNNYIIIELKILTHRANEYDIGIVIRDLSEQNITTISMKKNNINVTDTIKSIVFQVPLEFFNIKHVLLYPYIFCLKSLEYKIFHEPFVIPLHNHDEEKNSWQRIFDNIGFVNIPVQIIVS
ncbi:MAG: ABC transporter ATP-binding protein [Bacteroidales bacterium]|nr:ABC transporter ATP-binding protein [Bacteroidales bacterium]